MLLGWWADDEHSFMPECWRWATDAGQGEFQLHNHETVTLAEERFFKWVERDKSVSLRASGASYGGGKRSVSYTDTCGALCFDDYKGPNRQYVEQGKLVIEWIP